MALHKFTMTLEAASELPADAIVNTWYFEGSGSDPENVFDMLTDFYGITPTGGSGPLASYYNNDSVTGNYTIRGYDMTDPIPRAPMFEDSGLLASVASTGDGLPQEVALCMSYQAAPVAGVPMSRLRGRVYLGPFGETANVGGLPASLLLTDIARAGRDLLQASNASTSWEWRMYSPTRSASSMVVGGWVDNSWDTQRRRGIQSTARTNWDGGTP